MNEQKTNTYDDNTSPYCKKCGRPYTYVGDVFDKDNPPFCTCGQVDEWKFCPHCGKELK